jgi:type IV pilus assembly protein PilB
MFPDTEALLLQTGLIDLTQLRAAKGHQRQWGRSLHEAVIDLGFIAEEVLLSKIAALMGVEYVNIGARLLSSEILRRIPEKLVRLRRVFPIEIGPSRRGPLVIAMEDPRDLAVVDEIAFATGMLVEPVLASARDLDQAIARHY